MSNRINIGWILHPEKVLGLRGTFKEIDFYRQLNEYIHPQNYTLPDDIRADIGRLKAKVGNVEYEPFAIRCAAISEIVKLPMFKVYHFSKDLFEDLTNVENDFELFEPNESIATYISFPKGYFFEGAYAIFTKKQRIWSIDLIKDYSPAGMMTLNLNQLKTKKDLLDTTKSTIRGFPELPHKDYLNYIKTVMVCLLYIFSMEKVIEYIPAKYWLKKGEIKEYDRQNIPILNDAKIAVLFVNRTWMSPRKYSKEEHIVKGHLFYQAWGKNWTKHRWYWRSGYTAKHQNLKEFPIEYFLGNIPEKINPRYL